jgi:hypothetical protein
VKNNRRLNRVQRQRLSLALWMGFGSILLTVVLSASIAIYSSQERTRIDAVLLAAAEVAIETHDTLCLLKAAHQRDVTRTEKFIDEIRQGERGMIPGISLADLNQSLAVQRTTLKSLEPLRCNG